MSSGEQSNSNASVLLPIVQPADIKEFTQGVFFFQELNPKARHSFHPARAKKTTIPVNTVSPHPKFLAYFNKTEIGRRKGMINGFDAAYVHSWHHTAVYPPPPPQLFNKIFFQHLSR